MSFINNNNQQVERELEDYLYASLKNHKLNMYYDKLGVLLGEYSYVLRQPNLGMYGIPDLITFSYDCYKTSREESYMRRFVTISIIELKQHNVDASCFLQVIKYASALRKCIRSYSKNTHNTTFIINAILIGAEITIKNKELFYIPNLIDDVHLFNYDQKKDGSYDFKYRSKEFLYFKKKNTQNLLPKTSKNKFDDIISGLVYNSVNKKK